MVDTHFAGLCTCLTPHHLVDMHRAERALKKLGIQTSDLIATAFNQPTPSPSTSASSSSTSSSTASPSTQTIQHSSAASLRPDEYQLFWSQVSSPRESSTFLLDLLNRFVVVLEKEGKNATQSGYSTAAAGQSSAAIAPLSAGSSDTAALDAFLTTLNYLILCMPLQPSHPPLKAWLAGWAKQEGTRDCHHYPGVKEMTRLLALRLEGADMVGPVLIGASTLYNANEFLWLQQAMSDYTMLTTLDDDVWRQSTDTLFYYQHLHALARDGRHTAALLQSIINKMLTLQQQMKLNPTVATTTLLSLLHLLHTLLCLSPPHRSLDLQPLLSSLTLYYVWPEPIGGMVRDVWYALCGECSSSGEMMRGRLMEEVTTVALKLTGGSADTSDEESGEWCSGCFYFLDADDRHTALMARVMEMQRWRTNTPRYGKDEPVLLNVKLQAQVVLNALDSEGLVGEKEVNAIRGLSDEAVGMVFNECLNVLGALSEYEDDMERREQRSVDLMQVQQLLLSTAGSSSAAGHSSLTSATLIPPYLPLLPPVQHVYLPFRLTYEMLNKEQLAQLKLPSTPYPTTPAFAQLCSLLNSYRACVPSLPDTSLTVRLVLSGSDDTLHSFLCAYMLIRQQKRDLLQQLDLRLHVVPWGKRSELCGYMARCDGWYARHVYSVFRQPSLLLPSMRLEEEDITTQQTDSNAARATDPAQLTAPASLYRSCIEQYIRESNYTLPLRVWHLAAWLEPSEASQPDHLIPFLQRVEVIAAGRRARTVEAGGGDGVTEVTCRYRRVDSLGVMEEERTDDAALFASLLFAIVPRAKEPPFAASVTEAALHFNARLHRNYQRSGGKACALGLEGRGVLGEVEVRCVQAKEGVHVNIDGQVFGPYHRVRLSVVKEEGESVVFPIQTFFPVAH